MLAAFLSRMESPRGIWKDPLTLTHLDKVYWPQDGITKGDLIRYYKEIAPTILPYLVDRPESLNRTPEGIEGESFYQKNATFKTPAWLKTKSIASKSRGGNIRYVLCQNEATLLFLANLGCIEINPWLSRVGSLDKPDFLILDLDPEGIAFSAVIEPAQEIHRLLDGIGVPHYPKTSGKSGLHICVPLGARYEYEEAK